MRRILIFAGAGLGALLILLIALPFFVPASVYKAQIEKAASNALGRDVLIAGDTKVSIFPVLSASVEEVTVANPDGFEKEYMIEAGALRGAVRLLPLLSRRVEVNELSFEDASVRLTRRVDGTVNWQLGNQDENEPAENESNTGDPFSASISKARLRNATLIYEDLSSNAEYRFTKLDAEATLKSLVSPVTLRANGRFENEPFEIDLTLTSPRSLMEGEGTALDVKFGSSLGNLSFDGSVTSAETIDLNGQFSANVPELKRVSDFVALELPVDLGPFGGLRASGQVNGALPDIQIAFDTLALSDEGLNVNFNGSMVLGETPELDGNLSTTVRDIYALSQAASLSLPSLRPVKQVSLDTTLKGAIDELLFNNLSVQTAGPSLKTSYDGMLSLADAGNIEGRLEIESSQFRDLLSDIGFAGLPESSQLKSGSISGRATGTFSNLGLKDGRIVIDDTIVTGDISTDLSGRKPSIVADLNTTMVDLTPFIGTKSEASSSTRWSEAPLELAVLEVINARIDLRADGIRVGNINLQNAEVAAALDDGRLNARFEQFSAFGGDWQGLATVDASTDVPSFSFDLSANRVEAQTLLSTLAQFDRLSGAGAFSINVSSSGGTIRQMVNALEGNLSLDLDDGALRGLNLGQLVRSAGSLSEAISTGSLTLRTLGNVVSPQAETDFTTFSASLSVEQGLAQIQSLSLVNPVLAVSGAGQINLGGQTLDVRLTPAIDKSGQGNTTAVQLNGIPVPLRIQGNWMSPKFSPDVSGLQQALTATARERASSELKERIGGEFGSIIADAVGGKHPQSASESVEPSSDEGSENVSQAPPPADETNNNSDTDTTESQTPPKDDRPANVRDALDRILNPD